MNDPVIRGYQIVSMIDYIESPAFDAGQREAIYAALSSDVSRDRSSYDEMKWYPAAAANGLRNAMASLYGDDEARVYASLEGLGQFMANKATNTFLRLLLKILTPKLFAKQVPNFWSRDNRIGTMSADASALDDNRLTVHLRGMARLDHAVPSAAGFAQFAMTAMGMKDVKIRSHGWSLGTPAPDEAHFEISWS